MKRFKRRYCVIIGDLSTNVDVESKSDAIERAVEKLFGSQCFWFPNSGIDGYGQVFEALPTTRNNSAPGNSSKTSTISIEVTTVGKPTNNFIRQCKQDKIDMMDINAEIWAQKNRLYDAYIAGREGTAIESNDPDLMKEWREGISDQKYEESIISSP